MSKKIDWKSKLSSRKFWCALIALITAIMAAINFDPGTIERTVAVISSAAVLIAYILAEGMVDANRDQQIIAIDPNVLEGIKDYNLYNDPGPKGTP